MSDDYYSTLGVARTADAETIRRAYRVSARKCHPDLNPDIPWAGDAFRRVNEAYEVLSDPDRRALYDLQGAPEPRPARAHPSGSVSFSQRRRGPFEAVRWQDPVRVRDVLGISAFVCLGFVILIRLVGGGGVPAHGSFAAPQTVRPVSATRAAGVASQVTPADATSATAPPVALADLSIEGLALDRSLVIDAGAASSGGSKGSNAPTSAGGQVADPVSDRAVLSAIVLNHGQTRSGGRTLEGTLHAPYGVVARALGQPIPALDPMQSAAVTLTFDGMAHHAGETLAASVQIVPGDGGRPDEARESFVWYGK